MSQSVEVALLALPQSTAGPLFGIHDILVSVRRDWALLHGREPQVSPFRVRIVSPDGQPFEAANGVWIRPSCSFAECSHPQVAVVADLLVPPGGSGDGFRESIDWLKSCHAAGGTLASACSGAVLLAQTGLLEGAAATSHWAYCEHLQKAYPGTRWFSDRGLVSAGAGKRILMAGSGVSWHMLALAIATRYAGAEEALRVARINLMDVQSVSPHVYASLTHGEMASDPVIAATQRWAAMNCATEAPVAKMAALSKMAERTFKRRFAAATGMTPIEYIHHVRLEEAKQLLESGSASVEAVATEVGYSDQSFFCRLFKRKTGITPSRYRQRFGKLARQISVSV